VEVKMNKVERAVGASAFVAAAIVTVIVYDGRVTVENPKHERVVVAPGTTYTVEPPVEPPVETPVETPVDERTVGVAPPTDVTTCDEVSCVLTNYEGTCCDRYRPTKDTLDQSDIDGAIALVRGDIVACGEQHTTTGKVVLTVRVADSKVDTVKVTSTPDAGLGQCVAGVMKSAVFPAANELATFSVPFVFPSPIPPSPANCDAKAAREAGDQAMAEGKHAEALAHYETAAKCVADPTYVRLAFVAACNAKNSAKAKRYFAKLTQGERDKYRVVCIRNSVDLDEPKTACDADALKEEAVDLMGQGLHAGALAKLDAAIACRTSPQLESLAYASACNAKDATRAKAHYAKLSTSEQERLRPICARNNIAMDACDAAALKAKGLENVNLGQYAAALAQFEASLRCKEDKDVRVLAGKAACNSGNAAKVKAYNATCCDADGLKDKGMEDVNMGEHAKALALFDKSLACKRDDYVVALAFMAACNSRNTAKARVYYGELTASQQSKYKVMCDRNGVDLSCDADAFKDSGMDKINNGAHAEALALFEQSLACKADPYVEQLAFMAACNSRNATKARAYYAKLTPAQQSKFEMICTRNKVDLFDTSGDAKGYLQVFSQPPAKIFVDGVDTGLTTPIKGQALALTPGKHKVTFVIDSHLFTFPVQTKSGQTDTMTKDLR
jgi:tetratricopeptide (TPR) repeat protein